jgi:hypothetical protein
MTQSQFWSYVNEQAINELEWVSAAHNADVRWVKACELLLAELPSAKDWVAKEDDRYRYKRILMPELLFALAWGSFDGKSPKPMQYHPSDITLHFSEEEFENILFQKPPRGAITFRWDIYDEDAFFIPPAGKCIAPSIRDVCYDPGDEEHPYPGNLTGGVIGFIRGRKIELYVFPPTWTGILEHVYQELKKMTAKEKAKKQLSHELKALVDLLGWDAVNTQVQKLRP